MRSSWQGLVLSRSVSKVSAFSSIMGSSLPEFLHSNLVDFLLLN